MKTIALLAQKGGSGKTTLALHFAVQAERTAPRPVVVIDTDPQKSAAHWYEKRRAETPVLLDPGNRRIGDVLDVCRADGFELALIDTAPHSQQEAYAAASVADLIAIPSRAAILDIEAIESTVDIARRAETPAVIVLNAVRPKGRLTDEARQTLKVYGLPICPTAIVNRAELADGLIDGLSAQEYRPYGKAADEIAAVWRWIRRRI